MLFVCFGFNRFDGKEVAWNSLRSEIFKRWRQGADREAVSRRRALPAPCGPRLKSAWRKQDVKDFQTQTQPLTER